MEIKENEKGREEANKSVSRGREEEGGGPRVGGKSDGMVKVTREKATYSPLGSVHSQAANSTIQTLLIRG